jgi:hypothetical protein
MNSHPKGPMRCDLLLLKRHVMLIDLFLVSRHSYKRECLDSVYHARMIFQKKLSCKVPLYRHGTPASRTDRTARAIHRSFSIYFS